MAISQRVQQLRPTAVNSILGEVRALQETGVQLVSLMRGEPDFPTPPHIVDAAIESLRKGRTAYPNNQGEIALREAVAATLKSRFDVDYSAQSDILITTGATLGVHAALSALIDEGDEVLLPEPVYDAYFSVIRQVGGVPVPIAARITNGRFVWASEDVAAACGKKTTAILLNSPWNPTGVAFSGNELAQLMDVAARHDLTVVSDEIYDQFVYPPAQHVSPIEVSDDARSRTVLINSLSKTYAMTGWRLGYCAGPTDLVQAMYLTLQQSSRGAAMFVQDAGVSALTGDQECVAQMRSEYASRLDTVQAALTDVPKVSVLPPEGGFFAMLDVRQLGRPSNEIRQILLNEHHVVVMHGAAYGPAAEGTLRIAFANGGERLTEGLHRLRAGLCKLGS